MTALFSLWKASYNDFKTIVYGFIVALSICSPRFPGITGTSGPWSGGLELDSGMTLSSGVSGFAAFGTVGNKSKRRNSDSGALHEMNYNDFCARITLIIIWYICFTLRGYLCPCQRSVSWLGESPGNGKDEFRERLWNTLISLSCRKKMSSHLHQRLLQQTLRQAFPTLTRAQPTPTHTHTHTPTMYLQHTQAWQNGGKVVIY